MIRVSLDGERSIPISEINIEVPIFVKRREGLVGMVSLNSESGLWEIAYPSGVSKFRNFEDRDSLISEAMADGYDFFIEEK